MILKDACKILKFEITKSIEGGKKGLKRFVATNQDRRAGKLTTNFQKTFQKTNNKQMM